MFWNPTFICRANIHGVLEDSQPLRTAGSEKYQWRILDSIVVWYNMVQDGMVLSIVVWYDVVQDGMVMCGDRLELNGMMFYDVVLCGMISAWYGVVQVCMVWFRTIEYGSGWHSVVGDLAHAPQ